MLSVSHHCLQITAHQNNSLAVVPNQSILLLKLDFYHVDRKQNNYYTANKVIKQDKLRVVTKSVKSICLHCNIINFLPDIKNHYPRVARLNVNQRQTLWMTTTVSLPILGKYWPATHPFWSCNFLVHRSIMTIKLFYVKDYRLRNYKNNSTTQKPLCKLVDSRLVFVMAVEDSQWLVLTNLINFYSMASWASPSGPLWITNSFVMLGISSLNWLFLIYSSQISD